MPNETYPPPSPAPEQAPKAPEVTAPVPPASAVAKPASYQFTPPPPSSPPPPIGFVKPVMFPPMKDRLHRTVIRFRASLGTFVLVSVAAFLPSMLGAALHDRLPLMASAGLGILSLLLSLLLPYVMIAIAAGELDFGAALGRGFRALLPGIFTVIATVLVMILPSLLVIPAIILSVRFMLVMHVIVNERRKGIEALARSRDLVFGRTATLFFDQLGLSVLGGIIALVMGGIVGVAVSAAKPSLAAQSYAAVAGLFAALFYPFYIIYLQTFYEDCVAVVGKEWTAKPAKKTFYRILAALGVIAVLGMISLPFVFLAKSKFNLSDLAKLNVNASFGTPQQKENPDVPLTTPPKYSSTPDQRDLQRYGDVNTIKLALGSWFNDNKAYPDTLDQLAPKYLTAIPKDPDGPSYGYQKQELTYVISFTLEQGVLAFAKGPHTLTANGFDVVPQPTAVPPDDKTTVTSIPAPTPAPAPAPAPPSPLPPEPEPSPSAGAATDTDGDKLSDEQEIVYSTDAAVADTDGDGLSDGEEVYVYGTDPRNPDTDGDSFSDSAELQKGYDPKGPGMLTAEQKAQYDANLHTFRAQ